MRKTISFINTVKSNAENFCRNSFWGKCDIVSFALLLLFFVDCSFSGGGKYLAIGPLSFRMLVALGALFFAIPKFVINIKKYIKNPLLYMFFAFLVWLLFSAVTGIKANNNTEVLISDIKGFMWLFTVPALIVTVDTRKRFEGILNAIIIGAFIQAAMVLIIHFVCCLIKDGINYFYQPMLDLQIGTVSIISDTVFRIFMRSSPYMILACSIIFFKQLKQDKIKVKYILSIVILLLCVLFSFTRSLYGCAFIVFAGMVVVTTVFYRNKIKLMLKTLLLTAVSLLVCIGVLEFALDASYFNFAVSRTLGTPVKQSLIVTAKYEIKNFDFAELFDKNHSGDNTIANDDASDNDTQKDDLPNKGKDKHKQEQILNDFKNQQDYINETNDRDTLRFVTKQELKKLIIKSPIIGNGLGACSETRNGPDEYFYYDILARMGIIGLLLYVAPFIYLCFYVLRKRALASNNMGSLALFCGMMGFWGVSWFNPWMNAVLGIAVYSLCCSIYNVFDCEN